MSRSFIITRRNGDRYTVLYDAVDQDVVDRYSWNIHPGSYTHYVQRSVAINLPDRRTSATFTLHRTILCPADGFEVDHIDRNGLNNCRSNLRIVTHAQNMLNKKQYKNTSSINGVCWNRAARKWYVRVSVNKERIFLGAFAEEQDAIKARRDAEREHYLLVEHQ